MDLRICRVPSIDSTNAEAIRRANAGDLEGSVFVSDSQTKGRGREGRVWESPAGVNLYLSFLLRPPVLPADAVPITQMAARAVIEVLESLGRGSCFEIKWPNDILLNGKKVAGILCEMGSQGDRTQWVVCGIGINVNAGPEDFSPEVREAATSLKIEFGREFDREEILERLVQVFDTHYERFKVS